jgi:hypothetical protein
MTIISNSCVSVRTANLVFRRSVPDEQQAEAVLDWRRKDLAKAAKVGIATIRRIESQDGPVMGYVSTLMSIESAFESAGIHFLGNDAEGGTGVRLIKPEA